MDRFVAGLAGPQGNHDSNVDQTAQQAYQRKHTGAGIHWGTFLLLVSGTGACLRQGVLISGLVGRGPAWRTRLTEDCIPLLVSDPAAVEAERNAGRQVNARDRVGGEVLRSEDDQVGGAAVGTVHERHDVAIVLACVR
jgi:hypothetical protein